jgi:hypothetical protein
MIGNKVKTVRYTLVMNGVERDDLLSYLLEVSATFLEDMGLSGDELTFNQFAQLLNDGEVSFEEGEMVLRIDEGV